MIIEEVSNAVHTPTAELSKLSAQLILNPIVDDQYVLVVGGLGFIGSHTVWELLKERRNVIIVDNLSNSYKDVFDRLQTLVSRYYKGAPSSPHLEFYEADYRETPVMKSILGRYDCPNTLKSTITSVIHFSAHKAVEESIRQPLKYYSNNVAGLIDFCTLLDQFSIKTLVFSSSATVYGSFAEAGGCLSEELVTHNTTQLTDVSSTVHITLSGCTGLTSPYSRTKWMSEAILADIAASDPDWTVYALRFFNPIGCDPSGLLMENPREIPRNLMPRVIRTMQGQIDELSVFGDDWDTPDGTAVRDFVHVSDLARGHVAAIVAETGTERKSGFHVVNLGTGTGSSVMEVVETMRRISGKVIRTKVVERREGDVGVCIADPSKAAQIIGWTPLRSLEDSCRDICRYLDTHA